MDHLMGTGSRLMRVINSHCDLQPRRRVPGSKPPLREPHTLLEPHTLRHDAATSVRSAELLAKKGSMLCPSVAPVLCTEVAAADVFASLNRVRHGFLSPLTNGGPRRAFICYPMLRPENAPFGYTSGFTFLQAVFSCGLRAAEFFTGHLGCSRLSPALTGFMS